MVTRNTLLSASQINFLWDEKSFSYRNYARYEDQKLYDRLRCEGRTNEEAVSMLRMMGIEPATTVEGLKKFEREYSVEVLRILSEEMSKP